MKWTIAILLFGLCAVGCRPIKTVPVESVRTEERTVEKIDTVYIVRESIKEQRNSTIDSVKETEKESVTITLNERGDTLRTDRVVEMTRDTKLIRENEMLLSTVDSLKHILAENEKYAVVDSVQVPIIIEKPLSAWQRFKLSTFWWLAGALCVIIAWIKRGAILSLIKKLK